MGLTNFVNFQSIKITLRNGTLIRTNRVSPSDVDINVVYYIQYIDISNEKNILIISFFVLFYILFRLLGASD
jgi:energy-converting hydrogenase Eha subunit F